MYFQVIPTRLSDGQVVFLLSNSGKTSPVVSSPPNCQKNNMFYIASSDSTRSEDKTEGSHDEPLDCTLPRKEDVEENVWRPW